MLCPQSNTYTPSSPWQDALRLVEGKDKGNMGTCHGPTVGQSAAAIEMEEALQRTGSNTLRLNRTMILNTTPFSRDYL